MKKSVWSTIIKVIIASSYRIAGGTWHHNSVFSNFSIIIFNHHGKAYLFLPELQGGFASL